MDEREHKDEALWPPIDPVKAGISGSCPRCGQGRLFKGYLTIAKRCGVCGLNYAFEDSGDGPVVFVILLIGFLVVGLALWLEVSYNPPLWPHFILWVPMILILGLTALRMIKGLLIVFQFRNKVALERHEDS